MVYAQGTERLELPGTRSNTLSYDPVNMLNSASITAIYYRSYEPDTALIYVP